MVWQNLRFWLMMPAWTGTPGMQQFANAYPPGLNFLAMRARASNGETQYPGQPAQPSDYSVMDKRDRNETAEV
jgi:hypothetical protein